MTVAEVAKTGPMGVESAGDLTTDNVEVYSRHSTLAVAFTPVQK